MYMRELRTYWQSRILKKKGNKIIFDSRLIITSIWKKIYIITISTFIDLHI